MNGQIALVKAQTLALKSKKTGIYAQLESSGIQVRQIEDQISRCFISAPVDGTVLELYLREGELAAPGKAIFKMANLNEMILRVFISGDQLSSVKTGDSIFVRIDGADNNIKEFTGEIIWISSEAEFTPKIIQTRKERVNLVYAMKVIVKNSGEIKIGMPGEIILTN
jgi:HlyD family secretion protein